MFVLIGLVAVLVVKRQSYVAEGNRIHCCVLIGFVAVLVVEKKDGVKLSYNNNIQAPVTLLPVAKSRGDDCAQNV